MLLTLQVSALPHDAPGSHQPTPLAAVPTLAFPSPSGLGGPKGPPPILRLGETKMPARVHGTSKMQRNRTHLNAKHLPAPHIHTHTPPPPGSPLGLHTCRGRAPSGLSLPACVPAIVALTSAPCNLLAPHCVPRSRLALGLRGGWVGGIYPFCPTLLRLGSRTRPGTQQALN